MSESKERGCPQPQQMRAPGTARANAKAPVANGLAAAEDSRAPALREAPPPYRTGAPISKSAHAGSESGAPLRFIDLFCGIGGFRLAFERAGARCVFSSDWDKFSRQTYAANSRLAEFL